MTKTPDPPHKSPRAVNPSPIHADAIRLQHELEVHQIELITQNEELRATRGELEVALARYTELFDFAPVGYVALDASDIIASINHAGARLLGRERIALSGARFAGFVEAVDADELAAVLEKVRRSGEPATTDLRVPSGGDEPRIISVRVSAQPRDPAALLLAFEDVTIRRAEQRRLVAAELALRETNCRKDEFLAMLSHELRNPLAPIRTSLFLLASCPPGSSQANDAREVIDRQVAHLTRIVEDLLDVTRITRGKTELKTELADVVELVRRAIHDHRAVFDAQGVALESLLSPDPLWVELDGVRIVQAVSNVLGNSLKFTPKGGRVTVSLERQGLRAELRVRDTGGGIAKDLIPHVFEPFTQAPQAHDRKVGGLGLGLAVVKGLVELHGGSVEITSEGIGRGVEVIIRLPLGRPPRTLTPARPLPRMSPRRVLVIEDNSDAADVLGMALTVLGHEVRVVGDGPAGLVVAREFLPEVVLCDIGLPGMDGYAVARAFSEDPVLRGIMLVALTGYAQPDAIARATEAGFRRHIPKPASIESLAGAIATA